jgi:hypothetical protein
MRPEFAFAECGRHRQQPNAGAPRYTLRPANVPGNERIIVGQQLFRGRSLRSRFYGLPALIMEK